MDAREAEELLADSEVVPVAEAPLSEAKQLLDACLAADIPTVLGRDDHCKVGCAPKLLLLARTDDVPKVVGVLRARWRELLENEGTFGQPIAAAATEGDDLPCPACGTTIPADASECPDCGLVV